MSTREVVVATIGRAHGLKGELSLRLRTDIPEERLQEGVRFEIEVPAGPGGAARPQTLTIVSTRIQQDRWYVRFAEVGGRSEAEALRGQDLVLEVDEAEEAEEDPDAWYPSQLKGLTVVHVEDRRELGTVVGVEHYPAQDLLVVRTGDRRRVQLPLVEQLVPEVDLEAGIVVADPPGGLFDALAEDADGSADGSSADGSSADGSAAGQG
ncbi:ribosome maturation factor RimM [Brachybacterium sp. DNPG3]